MGEVAFGSSGVSAVGGAQALSCDVHRLGTDSAEWREITLAFGGRSVSTVGAA